MEGRGNIGNRDLFTGCFKAFNHARHGGLQAGEGEIVAVRTGFLGGAHELAVRQAAREHEGVAVTLGGGAINRGAARVVEAEQSGDLVVGLACCIVEGRAEQTHIGGNIAHLQDFGMTARD